MKQLGNLALVCARRPDVLLQIQGNSVSVHVGQGPQRTTLYTQWDNDKNISTIIKELNFGKYAEQRSVSHDE